MQRFRGPYAAEQRFPAADRWGSWSRFTGRAHALGQAGRCNVAVQAFAEYASFVGKDDLAIGRDGPPLRDGLLQATSGAHARRNGAPAPPPAAPNP